MDAAQLEGGWRTSGPGPSHSVLMPIRIQKGPEHSQKNAVLPHLPVDQNGWLLEMTATARRSRGGRALDAQTHGDHDVFMLLVVEIFDAQQQLVFLNSEMRLLANGQKHGVLLVPRTNA